MLGELTIGAWFHRYCGPMGVQSMMSRAAIMNELITTKHINDRPQPGTEWFDSMDPGICNLQMRCNDYFQ